MSYTSLLNKVTLSEFTDLVEKDFSYNQTMLEPAAKQLFILEDNTSHTGDQKRYDEVDMQTFASLKGEGDDAEKVEAGVGYNKTMTAKRIAAEIEITYEMRMWNKKPQIVGAMTNLSEHCPNRLDLDLSHQFTFATSTSYTDKDGETITTSMGDGYALCYSAHSLANTAAVTYRNRVANDPLISQGALEAAETLAVTQTYNNFGEQRVMSYNTIITSPDPVTVRATKQILQSTADIDAAHSGVLNYYANAYRHVILPRLATDANGAYDTTKRAWWFLGAIGNGAQGSWQGYLGIWEQNHLKAPEEDVHSDNWVYGSRMSYGIVALSGKGIIGSCPTTA